DHDGEDWTLTDGESLAGRHENIGVFTIPAGVTVRVEPFDGAAYGALEVLAAEIHILGTLDGDGAGYPGGTTSGGGLGMGPGAGDNGGWTGCGGGYGGLGGRSYDQTECIGQTYGLAGLESDPWSSDDIAMGSGGGSGHSGWEAAGGAGGAKVFLQAPAIAISGEVRANGGDHTMYSGGGSGGGVLLLGGSVVVSGTLQVNGGNGQNDSGTFYSGGGGGGRIKVYGASLDLGSATVGIAGGAGVAPGGEAGTFSSGIY
ncbi:MAG: hypothetical protein JXR96_08495, partial [Deltaproteobacteria bacterium]|nr:hypothetical protein [Deltaproteobacteria bacterium]